MKKKVLITGGAGYVGSFLADELIKKNYQVSVLDLFLYGSDVFESNKINLIKGDIRNINLLTDHNSFNDKIFIKVRSTGKLLCAKLILKKDTGLVEILEDEKGISPGQACVFYSKDKFGERVLGGGWIDKTENKNLST